MVSSVLLAAMLVVSHPSSEASAESFSQTEFNKELSKLDLLARSGQLDAASKLLSRLSQSDNDSDLLDLARTVLDRRSPLFDPDLGQHISEFVFEKNRELSGKAALGLATYLAGSIHLADKELAVIWSKQALAHGEQLAHELLGRLYHKSGPELRDLNLALDHFRLYAVGHSVAPLISFARYLDRSGFGSSQCSVEPHELVEEYLPALITEANAGKASSQKELGRLFLTGLGVPENREEAVNWLKKASDNGDAGAKAELGRLGIIGSGSKTENLLEKAALAGNTNAASLLAGFLLKRNTDTDDQRALRFLKLAVSSGSLRAVGKLEQVYRTEKLLGTNKNRIRMLETAIRQLNREIAHLYPQKVAINPTASATSPSIDRTVVGSIGNREGVSSDIEIEQQEHCLPQYSTRIELLPIIPKEQ